MQHEGQHLPDVLELDLFCAAEVGGGFHEHEHGHQGAHREAVLRLRVEVQLRVLASGVGEAVERHAGDLDRVLGHVLELPSAGLEELEFAREELQAAAQGERHPHGADLLLQAVELGLREHDLGGHHVLGRHAFFDARQQLVQEARVEVEGLDHHVDAVAQRLDDLVGAAARVVVGGQVPSRRRALVDLVVDLRVVVRHDGQQGRLRAGGNAVVLVDDLDAHAQPLAPGDLDVLHALGVDHGAGQRVAQQVGDGHLRLPVLDALLDLAQVVAGDDAQQRRDDGLAAPRAADQEAAAPHRQVQERHEHVARVALRGGQRDLHLRVAEAKHLGGLGVVLDVVEGADDRVVDDPEVGLPQLLVERHAARGVGRRNDGVTQRPRVELGDVEPASSLGGARVRRGLTDLLVLAARGGLAAHAPARVHPSACRTRAPTPR